MSRKPQRLNGRPSDRRPRSDDAVRRGRRESRLQGRNEPVANPVVAPNERTDRGKCRVHGLADGLKRLPHLLRSGLQSILINRSRLKDPLCGIGCVSDLGFFWHGEWAQYRRSLEAGVGSEPSNRQVDLILYGRRRPGIEPVSWSGRSGRASRTNFVVGYAPAQSAPREASESVATEISRPSCRLGRQRAVLNNGREPVGRVGDTLEAWPLAARAHAQSPAHRLFGHRMPQQTLDANLDLSSPHRPISIREDSRDRPPNHAVPESPLRNGRLRRLRPVIDLCPGHLQSDLEARRGV